MYLNNEEENSKTKTSRSFSSAMDSIISNYEVVLLGPIDISTEVVNDETTFNSSFAMSGSPFFVGLNYVFHNGTAEDSTEYTITFTIDMLKNYRGMDYDVRFGTGTWRIRSTVVSYNQELTLTIPTDLDTYAVA